MDYKPSHYSSPLYTLFHTSASPVPAAGPVVAPASRPRLCVAVFTSVSTEMENVGNSLKWLGYKARARVRAVAESKSNLRCSRCIENSFRLRRSTPSGFAATGERRRAR